MIAHAKYVIRVLERMSSSDVFAVDTETSGFDWHADDYIMGLSIAFGDYATYLPVAHSDYSVPEYLGRAVAEAIHHCDAMAVYHHGMFDWHFLKQLDPDFQPPENYWDTQVVAWLIDENVPNALKRQADRLLGADSSEEQRVLGEIKKQRAKELGISVNDVWGHLRFDEIRDYARVDAELTLGLFHWQRKYLASGPDTDPSPVIEDEFRLQRSLWRMERRGVRIDTDKASELLSAAEKRLDELQESEWLDGLNMNSPDQKRQRLFHEWGLTPVKATPTGKASTDKEVLEALTGHPGVEAMQEYQQLNKAVTGYYRPLLDKVADDGRLHATFSSTRTVTGRLSARNPNLQTIPRASTPGAGAVRSIFIPADGYELWEFDLSQAELRIAASLCDEKVMQELIEGGHDLHTETAMMMFGVDEHEVDEIQRTLAKNANYGFPYGIGPKKFASYLVKGSGRAIQQRDIERAKQILNMYRRTYPNLAYMMGFFERKAKELGYLPLHKPGRFRHFRSPTGRQPEYYTALNALVQGGVGILMKDVMLEAEPTIEELGGRIVLQVHDSFVCELPPGTDDKVVSKLQEVTDRVSPFTMKMTWDSKEWA